MALCPSNAGVVRIVWTVRYDPAGGVFSFAWEESGGPPASAPAREGFGQTLLRRLMGASIGSEPVCEYTDQGFRYRFQCAIARIVSSPADEARI